MAPRRRTWFDDRGLVVASGLAPGAGDRALPFYAGAMHYWRVEPARWASCLRAIHDLGLTIVETYVPWRVHAPTPDASAWTGERDLAKFLDLARSAGLAVVLRPGPHVNAELTSFGMPDWVLAEPACQARTSRGTPAWLPVPPRAFPVPSYASTAFRAHVRAWYAQVAEIVVPFLGDPVVAIGVDNEAQLFFRTGAFDVDYHPDAIAWWREATGDDGEPPRDASDPARAVRWLAFKDDYLARALADFAAMLDDVGLGEVARFHNLPPGHFGLYDLPRIQRAIAGPVGIDAYTARAQFPDLRRRAAALVGTAQPLPLALEVGIGFFPWFPPLDGAATDPTRERDHLLTLLAAGVRGFNLFMAVERDRYYGAAIDRRGVTEPTHAAWIRPLMAALAEVDWPTLRCPARVALVAMRADARHGIATSTLDPMTPVLADALGLGPGGAAELATDAAAIAARRWQTALCRALELAQIPYAIVDEAADVDELARYRAVIAPTGERIDRRLWATLRALAERRAAPGGPRPTVDRTAPPFGGAAGRGQAPTVVVIGPGTPTCDELDQPLGDPPPKRIGRLEAASLDDSAGLAGLADALAKLAGDASDAWQVERPDSVRTSVFVDRGGAARVVFAWSDALHPVTAVVLAGEGGSVLCDPLSRERLRVERGRVEVSLPARGVRILVVE